jgi:hypothetical protein
VIAILEPPAGAGSAANEPLAADQVSFVMCIEANRLEPQGLLLSESIRAFGGLYANAPIVAISPRPELALGPRSRARLRELGVAYVVEPLNLTGHPYSVINRIVAGAWAEAHLTTSHLAVLDTDMILTAEPTLARADAGVRPVDAKGSASSGINDPLDAYWARICGWAGLGLDDLPMLNTSMERQRIRASYNGGFTVVRRSLAILQHSRDIFFRSLAEDLRPLAGLGVNVRASTGLVGTASSEWWGSSQAVLSAAIWSKTRNVLVYGPNYNIPLHWLADDTSCWPMHPDSEPVLLHYHYLAEPQYRGQLSAALKKIGCSRQTTAWVFARLGLFD